MQCALRSMAGGNFAAAAARFARCREQLVGLAEAAGDSGWTVESCGRLGDVCGSQVLLHKRPATQPFILLDVFSVAVKYNCAG